MIHAAAAGEVDDLRLVARLAFVIERGGLGTGTGQALDQLPEQFGTMAFLLDALLPDVGRLDLFCSPDVPLDLSLLENLLAGFGIDDWDLHGHLLNTVLAQSHGVADLDAAFLNGLWKADAPDTMDRAVIGADIGIGTFFGVLVIWAEFGFAGFN